ncbi:MAG: hypothetical protein AW08_01082 [Candidatus Accumulibacter adjunctus]|uniref:Uncharacterized protein n=1 Tax=Candidatus Accumulibacter adjunctus TaxID=1454001 RepID=A0A011NVW2_9PROT|nr:MAG: hypothetical protein AW08_01082 [Candidatus Accumulibacter adjunctus]
MHDGAVLVHLLWREDRASSRLVRPDRHAGGRAIADRDAGSGQADLQHVTGEVARRVGVALVCRRDVARRGVIVGPENCRPTAAGSGGNEQRHRILALVVDDRLRRFDHDFHAQRVLGITQPCFELRQDAGAGCDLLGSCHLGQGDDEVLRQTAAGLLGQASEEDVERADRTDLALVGKGLDANADERREDVLAHPLGDLVRRGDGVTILLVVRPIAVAILEVDAVVLDGLRAQLLEHPVVDGEREPRRLLDLAHLLRAAFQRARQAVDFERVAGQGLGTRQTENAGEDVVVRRIGVEGLERHLAEFAGKASLEQVGAAVYGVNRLPLGGIRGVMPLEGCIRLVQLAITGVQFVRGQRELHVLPP